MPTSRPPKPPQPPKEGATPYEVGYKKTPVETRFQPGVSGHPKGRPKGARNKAPPSFERLRDIIREEAFREIVVNDGDRDLRFPLARAVFRSIGLNAAKGQSRSQQLFIAIVSETELADKLKRDDYFKTFCEYKVWWERELERRASTGTTGIEPYPHPDHVIIDPRAGTIVIKGPMTKEELPQFQFLWNRITQLDGTIAYLERELQTERRKRRKDLLIQAIADLTKMRKGFSDAVGEPPTQRT